MVKKRYISIVLVGLFTIISISGVLMFFKIESMKMNMAHAWLGVLFVLVTIYHIIKNISFLTNYFKYISSSIIVILIIGLSVWFINPTQEELLSPKKEIMITLFTQPISTVAIFFKKDIEKIVLSMQSKGINIKNINQSLEQIANANDKSKREMFFMFFEKN